MDWEQHYRSKQVSAEEAVKVVKSGDRVVYSLFSQAPAITEALAARKEELRDVDILVPTPIWFYSWLEPGWEDSFKPTCVFVTPFNRQAMDEKRSDYWVGLTSYYCRASDPVVRPVQKDIDVVVIQMSPPNQHGYCCFGAFHWDKKAVAKRGKIVLAEVDEMQIRTYGDNYIHVSEIDRFVEHTSPPFQSPLPAVFDDTAKKIAEHVSSLIEDGDTIQIGTGGYTNTLPALGVFDDKEDLGWHSELTPPGVVDLVKKGLFRGPRKTLHPNKVVGTWMGNSPEDFAYVNENPLFEVYPGDYVIDIRVIAAHDNMVSINHAMGVDLTGQIACESIGPRMYSGVGGQPEFTIGAMLSKGGRAITVLPSTAAEGKISRISPALLPGTVVTIPRYFADHVVTEYGIARLRGKTQRQRAQELIAVAHPDFRSELKKEAEKLFWP